MSNTSILTEVIPVEVYISLTYCDYIKVTVPIGCSLEEKKKLIRKKATDSTREMIHTELDIDIEITVDSKQQDAQEINEDFVI